MERPVQGITFEFVKNGKGKEEIIKLLQGETGY